MNVRHPPVRRQLCSSLLAIWASAACAQNLPAFEEGQRLSHWLLDIPAEHYALGLQWQVPQEKPAQQALKDHLLARLAPQAIASSSWPQPDRERLRQWLLELPVTGRVVLANPEPAWLLVQPQQDPVLHKGQQVVLVPRPASVTVVLPSGEYCQVPAQGSADARAYLQACLGHAAQDIDWAWVAQPDGRSERVPVASWNMGPQDAVAPGAWVWAPARDSGVDPALSEALVRFLGTQGPAPDGQIAGLRARTGSPLQPDTPTPVYRSLQKTASDWGSIGLLQTPTARMAPAGDFRVHLSSVDPYRRLNVFMQPFDWLEAGFRYTDIRNVLYSSDPQFSTQSYKDKSFDLKLRLLEEQAWVPELALGMNDLGGTGLFAGEYIVASKRHGPLDFSLGLGWGYTGARGNLGNPLAWLSKSGDTRVRTTSAQGGTIDTGRMFTGPTAWFGGVQWQMPSQPLVLKLEYDGNDYRHEPFDKPLTVKSPLNLGLVYRHSPGLDFSIGFERGQTWMIGLTLYTDLKNLRTTKTLDPERPRWSPRMPEATRGQALQQRLESLTGWRVLDMRVQDASVRVRLATDGTVYMRDRLDAITDTLHEHMGSDILVFHLELEAFGLPVLSQEIDRLAYIRARNEAHSPATRPEPARLSDPLTAADTDKDPAPVPQWQQQQSPAADTAPGGQGAVPTVQPASPLEIGWGPSFSAILGGPDAFALYKVGLSASAQYRLSEGTRLSGEMDLRVLDNYSGFKYTGPSNLPRVRTYAREFETTSSVHMPTLQLTHAQAVAPNHFVSVYGGYLESMYAGVGAEWLYRPLGSPVAYGVDLNRVRQRDFGQDFRLRDYSVTTGHLNLYWDTGWQGVMLKANAGQYLAGDRGVTLDVSRRFDNGITVGAFATRTNVSAEQFGEGSFDKGVYLRIPFDAMLPRSSNGMANFLWRPLTRDGGARLMRRNTLFEMTSARDPQALRWGNSPSTPSTGDDVFGLPDNTSSR